MVGLGILGFAVEVCRQPFGRLFCRVLHVDRHFNAILLIIDDLDKLSTSAALGFPVSMGMSSRTGRLVPGQSFLLIPTERSRAGTPRIQALSASDLKPK